MINDYIIEYKPTYNSPWKQLDNFTSGSIDKLCSYMENHYHVKHTGYDNTDQGYVERFSKDDRESFRALAIPLV